MIGIAVPKGPLTSGSTKEANQTTMSQPEMKSSRLLLPILSLLCSQGWAEGRNGNHGSPVSTPSFQVDFAMPTADKPQSKLWFMHDSWWALLPRSDSPSLWERTATGWKEHSELARAMKGVPGRADVLHSGNEVVAVGVGTNTLTVFRIVFHGTAADLVIKPEILATLRPPGPPDAFETATLARDATGRLWVAAAVSARVCVWHRPDHGQWSAPQVITRGIDPDDICVITELPEGIGVIWSDQTRQAVLLRVHRNNEPAFNWEEEVVIDEGRRTADDHLNVALSGDGTVWVATKNSLDAVGGSQFVMRVRRKGGTWKNVPYVTLEATKRPSRPVVIATEDNSVVLTGYGTNDRAVPFPHGSAIVFSTIEPSAEERIGAPAIVISPDPGLESFVQNVTGPKHPFPRDGPWIILASDEEGRIYEANLRNFIRDSYRSPP